MLPEIDCACASVRRAARLITQLYSQELGDQIEPGQFSLLMTIEAMPGCTQSALGRALGFGTFKLGYGHRGINQPVMDRATGRVEVTAHNHGFAVDAPLDPPGGSVPTPYGRVEVSHVNLNDGVVEGLRCLDVPAFSVQYHPEAAAGPHDAGYLFDRFADLMAQHSPATPTGAIA